MDMRNPRCAGLGTGNTGPLVKKIAIIAGLEREVRPLVKHWPSRKVQYQDHEFTFYEGEHAVLVCGGIGQERAGSAAEAIIATIAPELVISAGVSGALVAELHVGDTIFPAMVIDTGDGAEYPTVIRKAPVGGSAFGRTVLASHDKIAGAAEKQRLAKAYRAHAVDMESAAVARAAEGHSLPFLAIKSISDELEFELPEMGQFLDRGHFQTARFLLYAVLRPWLWLRVVRLAQNTRVAALNLCAWLRSSALTNTIVPSPTEPRT
jgi:adenosylhomocysteine nucleosidase